MNDIYLAVSKIVSASNKVGSFEIDTVESFADDPKPIFIDRTLKKIFIPVSSETAMTTPKITSRLKKLSDKWTDFELLIAFYDPKLNVFYYRVSFDI